MKPQITSDFDIVSHSLYCGFFRKWYNRGSVLYNSTQKGGTVKQKILGYFPEYWQLDVLVLEIIFLFFLSGCLGVTLGLLLKEVFGMVVFWLGWVILANVYTAIVFHKMQEVGSRRTSAFFAFVALTSFAVMYFIVVFIPTGVLHVYK